MRTLLRHAFSWLCLGLLVSGCAGRPRPYERFLETEIVPRPDALKGRVVVLDAGHGGRYPGAVSSDGVREADVNLGVAQELTGLLRAAGAVVILTREGDHDLSEQDPEATLRDDLMARVGISNRAKPELFLSLHHNSRPGDIGRFNRVETYHRMADVGPSRDAAARIHQHLSANLGLADQPALLAGNYLVLRKSEGAAVLGEASYLTSRGMGRVLDSPRAQKLEARAYFAGILDYLGRGVPVLQPGAAGQIAEDCELILAPHDSLPPIHLHDPFGPGLDPQSVALEWDGRPLAYTIEDQTIRALPPALLPPGRHRLSVRARNLGGNAAAALELDVEVVAEPATLELRLPHPLLSAGPPVPVLIDGRTREELPVAPGTDLRLSVEGGTIVAGPTPFEAGRSRAWIAAAPGSDLVSVSVEAGVARAVLDLAVFSTPAEPPPLHLLLLDGERPLEGAWVRCGGRAARSDAFGRVLLDVDRAQRALHVECEGYQPLVLACPQERGELRVPMQALVPQLLGAEIVLDPAAGGDDPGAVGGAGTRAADLNLAVARYLGDYLRRAGARVHLTRDEWAGASGVDRVRTESPGGARLFVTIRHRGDAVEVAHYPTSRNGKRAAGLIAEEAAAFAATSARLREGAEFTLLMTAAPALIVTLPGPRDDARRGARLREPWHQRQSAWALLRGIVRYVAGEECEGVADAPQAAVDRTFAAAGGLALANALITLDDALPLQTTPQGRHFRPEIPGRPGTWSRGGAAVIARPLAGDSS